MENLGLYYRNGGGKLSNHNLIYKMMRVIVSKLKDDGGIDIRDSASGGRVEQGQIRIKTLLSAEFVSPCSSPPSDKTEVCFSSFFYFSFFLAKLSKVKVGWTLLGADFFSQGHVSHFWRRHHMVKMRMAWQGHKAL